MHGPIQVYTNVCMTTSMYVNKNIFTSAYDSIIYSNNYLKFPQKVKGRHHMGWIFDFLDTVLCPCYLISTT